MLAWPLMMWLWANAHPGFAIGFILMGLAAAGQGGTLAWRWLAARAGASETGPVPLRAEWRSLLWLVGISLAGLAALALTPYGPGLVTFPLRTVSIGVLRDYIDEWQTPDFHMLESQVFIWLLLATLAAIGLSGRRVDLTDLLMVSAFAYLSLLAGRNIATFGLVAAPVLPRHAQAGLDAVARGLPALAARLRPGSAGPPRPIAVLLNWLILALVAVAAGVKLALPLDPATNAELALRAMPVAAVDFLRRERPAGPMFNEYAWGGYLAWSLYPDYPIYIDGRTDLYDEAFLLEYVRLVSGADDWEARLNARGVRLLVIPAASSLAESARRSPNWVEAHRDPVAAVFERVP
jgi:hypothetical protein